MKYERYYLTKVEDDAKESACFVGTMAEIEKFIAKEAQTAPHSGISEGVDRYLSKLFAELGIAANLRGYDYLKIAVSLAYDQPTYLHRRVTLALYPAIAEFFGTKPSRVERAIRHAVTSAWDKGNPDKLNDIFGYCVSMRTGKPTNSEFIARIAELIRIEKIE